LASIVGSGDVEDPAVVLARSAPFRSGKAQRVQREDLEVIRVDRIFRDYRESGALNEQIAIWGFVDDATFLTKAGDVGLVFEMKGPDPTAMTHEERQRTTHQFESALDPFPWTV
jgi:hypothetical protein